MITPFALSGSHDGSGSLGKLSRLVNLTRRARLPYWILVVCQSNNKSFPTSPEVTLVFCTSLSYSRRVIAVEKICSIQ